MPSNTKLNLDHTFEDQRNLVNATIVPTVMRALDPDMFQVSDAIIYEMIHNRHKHQREERLRNQQSGEHQDEYNRRKHSNSRRNDISKFHSIFS
jgi:hypothetical protein